MTADFAAAVTPRIGELCAGYGGLGMAVQSVLGGEMAWCADNDPGASKILAHHWPDVPNHGDLTTTDWATVEPVDIITGGTPCQDLSNAGKRAGMRAGTRSGLWASMCDAIQIIRPSLVVWENVRGVVSAGADSTMEPCPGCVGDGDDGPVLRALGRVLGDLADLGFDARWYGLRAADVGAPHGRFRIFVVATDPTGGGRRGWPAQLDRTSGHVARHSDPATDAQVRGGDIQPSTPASCGYVSVGGCGGGLPDPDTVVVRRGTTGRDNGLRPEGLVAGDIAWGQYEPAIRRWQSVLGRRAPAPTELGRTGNPRLSPRFVEWMQGLPVGHVTDVPGLSRNEQLKALGNGVVPQQAAAALRMLLDVEEVSA